MSKEIRTRVLRPHHYILMLVVLLFLIFVVVRALS